MIELKGVGDEVLARILEFVDLQVANLWCAGDAVFNRRIARCCSHVVYRSTHRKSTLTKLPSMLSHLTALRVLAIDVRSLKTPLSGLVKVIQSLSADLAHLELRFPGASLVPLLSSLNPSSETESQDTRSPDFCTDCWSVGQYFPRLEKAKFLEEIGTLKIVADTQSFGIFPPSLLELSWTVSFKPTCDFKVLPRGLQALEVGPKQAHDNSPLDWLMASSLPPGLTYLSGVFLLTDPTPELLPRTISGGDFVGCRELTQEFLAGLPKGTQSMLRAPFVSLRSFTDVSWATFLPKSLTELEIGFPNLDSSDIKILPRTLTSLKADLIYAELNPLVQSCDRSTVWPQLWPPNLTILRCLNNSAPTADPQVYPDTLTELTGLWFPEDIDFTSVAYCLPKGLTHVGLWRHTLPTLELSSQLPAHWKTFEMEYGTILLGSLSMLPAELRILGIPWLKLDSAEDVARIAVASPLLDELNIKSIHVAALAALPRSVTHLSVLSIEGTLTEEATSMPADGMDTITVRPW